MDRETLIFLTPEKPVEIGSGNEALPQVTKNMENFVAWHIKETLKNSDQITLDASHSRVELANEAQSLDMAIDLAQSIEARNSAEKMLAHQMAACHNLAMTLLGSVVKEGYTDEIQRLVNCSARLRTVFQQGLLTLQRIRTGGRQEVIVQHVNVAGGQAIIGGR